MQKLLFFLFAVFLFGCNDKYEKILIERYSQTNGSIEEYNVRLINKNNHLFENLNAKDKTNLDTIKNTSRGIYSYLHNLKQDMIEYSGGYNVNGILINSDNFEYPFEFINNSDYKSSFKDKVNSLSILITKNKIFDAFPLILDPKDDPYWSILPDQKQKLAIELIFEKTVLPAALLSVSMIENRLLQNEQQVYETFILQELDSLRAR